MSTESLIHHGYGDEFESVDQIKAAIEKREKDGITNLFGSAILWRKKEGQDHLDRIGVRVLRDGSISFAHAEDL